MSWVVVLRGIGLIRLALGSLGRGDWVGWGETVGTVIGLKKAAGGSGTGLKKFVGGAGCATGSTGTGLKRETGAAVGGSG